MSPDAYALVPDRPNLLVSDNVFRYLEKPGRDALVKALDANPGKSLTVSSMLRTIAQQYLLYRWYQNGACWIGVAAKPGNSNTEACLEKAPAAGFTKRPTCGPSQPPDPGKDPGSDPGKDPGNDPGGNPAQVWIPAPRTTWQWILSSAVDSSAGAKVYDIDGFD